MRHFVEMLWSHVKHPEGTKVWENWYLIIINGFDFPLSPDLKETQMKTHSLSSRCRTVKRPRFSSPELSPWKRVWASDSPWRKVNFHFLLKCSCVCQRSTDWDTLWSMSSFSAQIYDAASSGQQVLIWICVMVGRGGGGGGGSHGHYSVWLAAGFIFCAEMRVDRNVSIPSNVQCITFMSKYLNTGR